jgi:hypothetical protein
MRAERRKQGFNLHWLLMRLDSLSYRVGSDAHHRRLYVYGRGGSVTEVSKCAGQMGTANF